MTAAPSVPAGGETLRALSDRLDAERFVGRDDEGRCLRRRLMDIAVMYRLGHASITSSGIETVAAGSISITDLWAHMAENAAYRTYVGSL